MFVAGWGLLAAVPAGWCAAFLVSMIRVGLEKQGALDFARVLGIASALFVVLVAFPLWFLGVLSAQPGDEPFAVLGLCIIVASIVFSLASAVIASDLGRAEAWFAPSVQPPPPGWGASLPAVDRQPAQPPPPGWGASLPAVGPPLPIWLRVLLAAATIYWFASPLIGDPITSWLRSVLPSWP
jgi:hypothetical protein